MKTSLLLIGLVMGVGLAGTAQAANTSASASSIPNVPNQTLVASSMTGDGVLSTLGDLLSGKATKQGAVQPCADDTHAPDKGKPCQPHAAAPVAPPNPHHPAGAAVPRTTRDGNPSASSSSAEPSLGWQSLLPGSIQ